MTEPGFVSPAPPGWWVRTARVGIAEAEIEIEASTSGVTPLIYYKPKMRPANPNVGPMALRHAWQRRPKSQTRKIAPSYDSTGVGNKGSVVNNGTLSWSHTIGARASAVFVAISVQAPSATVTATATVGGEAMTALGSITNYFSATNNGNLFVFGKIGPLTGSQTVAVTMASASGGYYTAGNSLAYVGVESFGTAVTANGTSATPSVSVPSNTSEMVAAAFSGYTTTFASFSQTQRFNVAYTASSNVSFAGGDGLGSATTTFSTSQGSQAYAAIAVPLQPLK